MKRTYNLIDSLVAIVQTICAVGLIGSLLSGCTPVDSSIEGTAEAPNTMVDFTYYQDPRTGICFALVFNRYEGATSVECTPKVMALIRGPAPTIAPEAVR